jgi:glycosyltransferase involved in cell wall biosynthesis
MLALPSYHEGVPNVLLEAMACGVPIVATNIGGIPEIIDEKICGKLIAVQNAEQVTSAIQHILQHEWSSAAIKQHSQKFSWSKNKEQLIKLIEPN